MKKGILYFLLLFVATLGVSLLSLLLARPSQEIKLSANDRGVVTDSFSYVQIDSIEARFSKVETLPEYRDVILTVLANYPDFEDLNIQFKFSFEKTTMACRPDFRSALKGKRSYQVFINNNPNFEGILLSDVPRKAQIGVIAHELAHILEYETYNNVGIIQLGLMYLDDESKMVFERETDILTISRGFGEHLKAWAQYSMYDSPKATQAYKEFKRKIYMSPTEIEKEMRRYSCYSLTAN